MGVHRVELPLGSAFHEDVAWAEHVRGWLPHLPDNVVRICEYGFLEMANNANDHSGSDNVEVRASFETGRIELTVRDFGVGIFNKIKNACGLDDERTALFELTKGKLTTDPERHTGEGIFFASRMFDNFSILSGHLFLHYDQASDWLTDTREDMIEGTLVNMEIAADSKRTTKEIFDRYATEQNDYGFKQTTVSVRLLQTGGGALLSRSHARRILARLEQFSMVVLDFSGVSEIAPAFADEIFRVWRKTNPQTRLVPIRTSGEVEKMINKALAAE